MIIILTNSNFPIILQVNEATQHCRNAGLSYEFQQSQVMNEFGIFDTKVLIFDKDNRRKAEWPTARLEIWLNIVREEQIYKETVFESFDIEWELNTDDEKLPNDESLNSSKISLNLSVVKDFFCRGSKPLTPNTPASQKKSHHLNRSFLTSSVQKTKNTNRLLTYEDECDENEDRFQDFEDQTRKYISEMQKNTLKMKKLCTQFQALNAKHSNVEKIKESVEEIEGQIGYISNALTSSSYSPSKTPKLVRFFLD